MTQISPTKSTGGVIQISAAATQKNAPPRKTPKPAAPRLKLLVRRLPPGLTQAEFESALGEQWKVGAGKVDWFRYKPGKVSKDPAKPSRPSRAYIHVLSSEHIAPLSDKIRTTSFLDARNTIHDPVLMGPPSLEFAPYAKIAGSRVRKDARQGTIDQDPDFIDFLESLTQPITKAAPVEAAADGEEKKDAVAITPLVQYIKEKKANKAKESAIAAKSSKHGKADRESKPEKVQAKKLLQRPDKETTPPQATEKKSRADKATRDAIKAANKQAASVAAKSAAKTATPPVAPKDAAPTAPAPERERERKRERGNVSAAAKIVQRDLGLAPAGGRRRGAKAGSPDAESPKNERPPETATTASETGKKDTTPAKPARGGPSSQNAARGKGTAPQPTTEGPLSRGPSDTGTPPKSTTPAPTKPSRSGRGKQASTAPPPPSTATQAFLKHANPSQGVTEPLLETAFSPFGTILKVEIDKKKGFGYVDFAEPESLQKAIAASPVTVAQSQVVVLERKLNPGGEKSRKSRNEQSTTTANNGNPRGGKSGAGAAEAAPGTGTPSGSRGRGGRGRGKGGSKGGGNGNNAGEKAVGESK